MKLQTLFCFILFSTLFWMKFTTDFLGWSIVECTTASFLLFLMIKKESILLPRYSFLLPVLVLTLYSATSSFWSPNFHATLTGTYKLLFILLALILFCNDRSTWIKAMEHSILLVSIVASIWNLSGIPMTHSNHLLAGFISAGTVFSCARLFSAACRRERLRAGFLLALFLYTLFVLASLAAILAAAAGIFFLFLFQKKKLWIFSVAILFLLLLSFFEPGKTGFFQSNPLKAVWQRKKTDPFAFERAQIWKDSFFYFKNYAFFGSGMGTYRDVYPEFKTIEGRRNAPYAHNEIFNILCELGIVGMSILLWFVWNLYSLIKKQKEAQSHHAQWFSAAIVCLTHSLFDFNLHYPPTLTIFLFSLSLLLPIEERNIKFWRCKWGSMVLLLGLFTLFLLPGLAEFIFKRFHQHPEKRAFAIERARKLDPFFSFYHSQTGKMSDLLLAIDLEPRNVWYRRAAAQFYLRQWEKSGKEEFRKEALEQYAKIVKFAPNVLQFQQEAQELEKKLFLR